MVIGMAMNTIKSCKIIWVGMAFYTGIPGFTLPMVTGVNWEIIIMVKSGRVPIWRGTMTLYAIHREASRGMIRISCRIIVILMTS